MLNFSSSVYQSMIFVLLYLRMLSSMLFSYRLVLLWSTNTRKSFPNCLITWHPATMLTMTCTMNRTSSRSEFWLPDLIYVIFPGIFRDKAMGDKLILHPPIMLNKIIIPLSKGLKFWYNKWQNLFIKFWGVESFTIHCPLLNLIVLIHIIFKGIVAWSAFKKLDCKQKLQEYHLT